MLLVTKVSKLKPLEPFLTISRRKRVADARGSSLALAINIVDGLNLNVSLKRVLVTVEFNYMRKPITVL